MDRTQEFFPDGTPIDQWFYGTDVPGLEELGRQYVLTQHNILDDGRVHTAEIQQLIDTAAEEGGGVIVVPAGTYLTGSLFFRQGVNLYVGEGGTLKGSDDISDYKVCETRIEGETCQYFAALINADGLDGFTCAVPEPSTETVSRHGRHSGSDGPGTPNAPTRTNSAPAWYIYPTVPMS